MEIQPRLLLWLIPVFACLFLSGMALGYLTDRTRQPAFAVQEVMDGNKRAEMDRAYLMRILDQIREDQERPFEVHMSGGYLKGRFRGEQFLLEGSVDGRQLLLKRGEEGFSISVDGELQDPLSAPYALFTPYEHASLIKTHLHELSPLPVIDPQHAELTGFQLTLPPRDVKAMLAGWLGPAFPTEDVFDRTFRDISVGYQVWIDPATDRLDQLVLEMRLDRGGNSKQDRLLFRLVEPGQSD